MDSSMKTLNPPQKASITNSDKAHLGAHSRDNEVSHLGRGPADSAVAPLPPDANVLVLVGQVLAAGKVVRLH